MSIRNKIPNHINHIYLMLTEYCPLRCEYCYIGDRDNKKATPMDTIDKAIKLFSCETPRIIFFGGEPLTQLNLMEEVFTKHYDHCQFQVITSGVVNFKKFVDDILVKNRDKWDVQVSWDGKEEGGTPSQTRKLVNGNIVEAKVFENIMYALEKGCNIQVRGVLNDTNIPFFFNTYKIFRDLRQKYRITGDFTIAHQMSFSDSFKHIFKEQLTLVLKDIQESLEVCPNTKEDLLKLYMPLDVLNKMRNYLNNEPERVSSCDAGNYVVLRPNGDLFPCTILSQREDSFSFKIGNVFDKAFDWDGLEALRHKSEADDCKTCKVRKLCDGGCRYERVINFGFDWEKKVCGFTCDNMNVWNDCFQEFFFNLSPSAREKLNVKKEIYDMWIINYSAVNVEEYEKYKIGNNVG